MSNYTGNMTGHVPGSIAHNWWVGGSLFQTMIQYWYFTEDASNNAAVSQGMYWQRGDNDFSPSNFSAYMSNDDQMSWGLAAMTAAELGYPQDSGMPSWLTLAEGVFNAQVPRWDTKTCDGGLRWQIRPYQAGYTIKNAISNGGLFQLSARLAHYTKNQTYFEWAEKIWDWSASSAILDTQTWSIADSIHAQQGCESPGNMQWTYNYGPYINGAAYMYNVVSVTCRGL
jgi:mannan endo-1,6-alpha-mannosidase